MSQQEPLPVSEIPEKDMPDADDKFIIDTAEGVRKTKMERIYERMESLYNDTPETLAGDIIKRVDKNTGENVNYREVTTWHDGTPMTDAKADGVIFIKKGSKYYKRQYVGHIHVKWFGAKGDGITDDSIAIQKAFAYKNGVHIEFEEGKTYLFKNGIFTGFNQVIHGNRAIFKRADESKTTLTSILASVGTVLQVASVPSDWKVGDTIHLFSGVSAFQTTQALTITDINGNSVTVSKKFDNFNGGASQDFPIGTGVRKVFNMINGHQYPKPCNTQIFGVNFDGNSANNASNYWWYHNTMIHIYGHKSVVAYCEFKDVPNENISCSGTRIFNNYANNLNGSFAHMSSPPETLGENIQGTFIFSNRVIGSNAVDPDITAHSYAVIETSWNPGKLFVYDNHFESKNKFAYAFEFARGFTAETADTTEFMIHNNIFKNYAKISNDIGFGQQVWVLEKRSITGNQFIDCGAVNYSYLHLKNIVFANNLTFGDTVITGLQTVFDNVTSKTVTSKGDSPNMLLEHTNGNKGGFANNGSSIVFSDITNNVQHINMSFVTGKMILHPTVQIGVSDIVGSKISYLSPFPTLETFNITYPTTLYPVGIVVIFPNLGRAAIKTKDLEWKEVGLIAIT